MREHKDNACSEISMLTVDAQNEVMTNLEAWAYLKEIEGVLKMAMSQVKDKALAEAASYDENTFEEHGYEFVRKAGARRWNFKKIHEWVDAKDKLTEVEDKYKIVYQNRANGLDSVDGDEVLQVPEVNTNAPSLLVTQL
jgi:hypothetical protein